LHLGAPNNDYDALQEAQEFERLLLESTDSSPCLQRAKMLITYAFMNPLHSQQLIATVLDLIEETAIDVGPEVLAEEEKKYWASEWVKEGSIGDIGIEAVIASGFLKFARVPKKISETEQFRLEALRGVRRLFYEMFSKTPFKEEIEEENSRENFLSLSANFVCMLRSLTLFEDGFGEFISDLACKNESLELWNAILRRANIDPKRFPCRHMRNSGEISHTANNGDSWSDLDELTEHYICLKSFDADMEPTKSKKELATEVQSDPESQGVLSRLGSLSLDFITSIV